MKKKEYIHSFLNLKLSLLMIMNVKTTSKLCPVLLQKFCFSAYSLENSQVFTTARLLEMLWHLNGKNSLFLTISACLSAALNLG